MKLALVSAGVYGLLGPLVGALYLTILGFLAQIFWSESPVNVMATLVALPFVFLVGLGFSFWLGGLQALFVGLTVGVLRNLEFSNRIWNPVLLSVSAWVLFCYFSLLPEVGNWRAAFLSSNAILWLSVHVVSAASVWYLWRWWTLRQKV